MPGLRIIAGKARGRRLKAVPGDSTRPITDRVKESLFDIIGADIQGARLLDLFAGTGSVGIEALSRGAAFVRFLDLNRLAVNTIRVNLETTGLKAGAEVLKIDAFALLGRPADRIFDYVYIAPPQYKELWLKALTILDGRTDWLSDDAWVIAQIHPAEYRPIELKNLVEFDQRHYGSTLLVFFEQRTTGLEDEAQPD
ncbi:MAG: 16S rRNA (guanine(966)-N(2))-methyltransferase RsmD [Chloroflexota bacterium]|nr:MAG: 16S rRNA (guanine(966)-N(2))-methyltransferase RsmD [Chloroflexota bacterium]